jgi:hypothetical protein
MHTSASSVDYFVYLLAPESSALSDEVLVVANFFCKTVDTVTTVRKTAPFSSLETNSRRS